MWLASLCWDDKVIDAQLQFEGDREGRRLTATFPGLTFKQIKQIRLQHRPYTRGSSFRNVSAEPWREDGCAGGSNPRPFQGASAPVTHKVVDGDSLASLAERYLGSSSRAMELYEANRDVLTRPDVLPIGAELKIPQALKGQDLPDLQVAQARFNAAKSKADDDTGIRYAEAAAEVAKRDYEYNKAASATTPGSVPIAKLLELSLKCTETDLALELAKLNKRLAGEDVKIANADLELARFRNGPNPMSDLPAAQAKHDAETAEAKYGAASTKAGNIIDIRYAAAAAAVRKADYDFMVDADKKVPGVVPKAKLDELLARCKEADLAVEKAKRQQQAEVEAVLIANAELDAARRKADGLNAVPEDKAPDRTPASRKTAAQRIATLEELVRTVERNYEAAIGLTKLGDLYEAQDKLLSAQLDAAESRAERVADWGSESC